MDTTSVFSADYKTARNRFREAAEAVGWELLKYPIASHGPDGEELTIDVAIEPGGSTDRALIISGGLHGVEGFFGSAVQLSLLREWDGEQIHVRSASCSSTGFALSDSLGVGESMRTTLISTGTCYWMASDFGVALKAMPNWTNC